MYKLSSPSTICTPVQPPPLLILLIDKLYPRCILDSPTPPQNLSKQTTLTIPEPQQHTGWKLYLNSKIILSFQLLLYYYFISIIIINIHIYLLILLPLLLLSLFSFLSHLRLIHDFITSPCIALIFIQNLLPPEFGQIPIYMLKTIQKNIHH